MTKREFDKLTKVNHGPHFAQRTYYYHSRHNDKSRAGLLERRAAYLAHYGKSPLWIGSHLRAPAMLRLQRGR